MSETKEYSLDHLPDEQTTVSRKTIGFSFDRNEESNSDRTLNLVER